MQVVAFGSVPIISSPLGSMSESPMWSVAQEFVGLSSRRSNLRSRASAGVALGAIRRCRKPPGLRRAGDLSWWGALRPETEQCGPSNRPSP